jgi:hypothetical protein
LPARGNRGLPGSTAGALGGCGGCRYGQRMRSIGAVLIDIDGVLTV